MTSKTTTPDFTDFVDAGPEIGDTEFEEEYTRACEILDDCYTEVCEDTPYTILARPTRQNEASGIYVETSQGLQILGYSIPVPDEVAELMFEAFEMYCAMPRD